MGDTAVLNESLELENVWILITLVETAVLVILKFLFLVIVLLNKLEQGSNLLGFSQRDGEDH